MTIDEFIEKLEKTPRQWEIEDGSGDLRLGPCCPITAVDGGNFGAAEWEACGKRLRLRKITIRRIMDASDDLHTPTIPGNMRLRRRRSGLWPVRTL